MNSKGEGSPAAHRFSIDLPVQGQGLALDLVSTEYIRGGLRGHRVDYLVTPSALDIWVATQDRGSAPPLPRATELDLLRVRELRGAIRSALEARFAPGGVSAQPSGAREIINLNVNASRRTFWLDDDLRTVSTSWVPEEPWTVAMTQIAGNALHVLSDDKGYLHPCPAPACILFFWDETGRKRWCSAMCGTRVRVARHHAKR